MKIKKFTINRNQVQGVSAFLLLLLGISIAKVQAQAIAFPGAEGFGANASGGRGGQVIFVTNTNLIGPGSLQEALDTPGDKYILFRCSGYIDGTVELPLGSSNITIAGQTSPHGIIVKGLLSYNDVGISTRNLIIRHIRGRAGNTDYYPTTNFVTGDGITLGGVHNAIVDHCSFGHNGDEAFDISRSSGITVQNCIITETLGSHGYLGGMLINYSLAASVLDSLSIHHNIWNRIGGRFPEINCESPDCNNHRLHAEVACNVFYDQGAVGSYGPDISGGGTGPSSFSLDMNIINNYSVSPPDNSIGMYDPGYLNFAPNNLYVSGNAMNLYPTYSDYQLFYCCNDFNVLGNNPNTDNGVCTQLSTRHAFPAITYTPIANSLDYMVTNAGAFPRDPMDIRVMSYVANQTFDPLNWDTTSVFDALNIPISTTDVPTDTDNDGMPDYWETIHGLSNSTQDHNGTTLSATITGVTGYTNLECYLNCLADALVNGSSAACQVSVGMEQIINALFTIYPNPAKDYVMVELIKETNDPIYVFDALGKKMIVQKAAGLKTQINLQNLAAGMYYIKIGNYTESIIKQ